LRDLTFRIEPKSFQFLTGPSGAGKTTLIRLFFLSLKPTRGLITIFGKERSGITRQELPLMRRRIGVVFQDFRLLPDRTLEENVAFALRVHGEAGRVVKTRVEEALETVGLSHKIRKYPHELSGGEQQRVGIARALVHSPRLLVADEPTGNIDPATAWELMQLLLRINAAGSTVVMATHNRDIVDVLRRRVVAIDHGRIVRDAPTGMYHEELTAHALRA
jgi:cell division transport system ATP-binding protein